MEYVQSIILIMVNTHNEEIVIYFLVYYLIYSTVNAFYDTHSGRAIKKKRFHQHSKERVSRSKIEMPVRNVSFRTHLVSHNHHLDYKN